MAALTLSALELVPSMSGLKLQPELLQLFRITGGNLSHNPPLRQWLLGSALRDAVESMNMLLNDGRDAIGYSYLAKQNRLWGANLLSDTERQEAFRYLGLNKKLTAMRDEYGVRFRQDIVTSLVALGTVRNCLVHRLGYVDKYDVRPNATLTVSWRRHDAMKARFQVTSASSGGIDSAMVTRTFAIGSQIDFTSAEFADIAAFLCDCVDELSTTIETACATV